MVRGCRYGLRVTLPSDGGSDPSAPDAVDIELAGMLAADQPDDRDDGRP